MRTVRICVDVDGENLKPPCLRSSYLSLMPKSKDQLPFRPDSPGHSLKVIAIHVYISVLLTFEILQY